VWQDGDGTADYDKLYSYNQTNLYGKATMAGLAISKQKYLNDAGGMFAFFQSAGDSAEYYFAYNNGGSPAEPNLNHKPLEVFLDGANAGSAGTPGSLASGEWGWGNHASDSLGFETIYVQMLDDRDPDSCERSKEDCVSFRWYEWARPSFQGYKFYKNTTEQGTPGNKSLGWGKIGDSVSGTYAGAAVRWFAEQWPIAMEVAKGLVQVRLLPDYWDGHYYGYHWLDDTQRKAWDITFRTGSFSEDDAKAWNAPLVIHQGYDFYHDYEVPFYLGTRFSSEPAIDSDVFYNDGNKNWLGFGMAGTAGNMRENRRYNGYPLDNFIRYADPHYAYMTLNRARAGNVRNLWVEGFRYTDTVGRNEKLEKLTCYQCPELRDESDETGYYTSTNQHFWMPWNVQHADVRAVFDAWRLYGDYLSRDMMKHYALEMMMAYVDLREVDAAADGPENFETRQDGWPFWSLAEAYRVFGRPNALAYLDDWVNNVAWGVMIDKNRGFYSYKSDGSKASGHCSIPYDPANDSERVYGIDDYCSTDNKCEISKVFQNVMVSQALQSYYYLTRSEVALAMVQGMHQWVADETYINRCCGFVYAMPLNHDYGDAVMAYELSETESCGMTGTTCDYRYSVHKVWQETRPLSFLYVHTGLSGYRDLWNEILDGAAQGNNNISQWMQARVGVSPSQDWWEMRGYHDKLYDHGAKGWDQTAPRTITDLVAIPATSTSAALTWTAPVGAVRYQVKYSRLPIKENIDSPAEDASYTNWWAATNATNEPIPQGGGAREEIVITGLDANLDYYFAVKSFDENNNLSEISNIATTDEDSGDTTPPANPKRLSITTPK
jgi:hypothetical protein